MTGAGGACACVCVCACLRVRRPPPELPYLVNLAVHPKHRRRGLGAQLVVACERVAREEWGYSEMFLYVRKQNMPALSLYYSLGYVCEFSEPVWYKLKSGGQRMQPNPKLFLRKDPLR
jgi:ribosomal protein S18 acetylase RimI-like enzyme